MNPVATGIEGHHQLIDGSAFPGRLPALEHRNHGHSRRPNLALQSTELERQGLKLGQVTLAVQTSAGVYIVQNAEHLPSPGTVDPAV